MGYGEPELVERLNKHFRKNSVQALAYRQPQVMRRTQKCDITVDSRDTEWFLALEVKSRKGRSALNFTKDFQEKNDRHEHQLIRLCNFANETGRTPIVYYICKGAKANGRNEYYSLDAFALLSAMQEGKTSIHYKDLSNWNLGWFDT